MLSEARELEALMRMSREELASRANAWAEVQAAAIALLGAIERCDTAQTSPEVAAVASRVLAMGELETNDPDLLTAAKTLAGSALAQYPGDDAAADHPQLPLEEAAATRALADAQRTHQADPLIRTVVAGPGTIGLRGNSDA